MKIWILKPRENLGKHSPWEPWYDKAFGFVVRADSEDQARMIAYENQGSEGRVEDDVTKSPWIDSTLSSCEELNNEGNAGLLLRDFASA